MVSASRNGTSLCQPRAASRSGYKEMACHLLQRVPEQDLENELARLWLASLADTIKKNWIGIQKKHDVPVNAIGMEIHPHDPAALKVWRSEGIDKFMKK